MNSIQYILNDQDYNSCYNCFQLDRYNNISTKPTFVQSDESCCSCCSCQQSILEEETIDPDQEKKTKKKKCAIDELLQTERDYVLDLNFLAQACSKILNRQSWILSKDKQTITRNILDILSFHTKLIGLLGSVKHDNTLLAKIFLDQMTQFTLYKTYCGGHSDAWSLISTYRDRSEWTQFVKECSNDIQTKDSEKRLYLEDYLIKPVQRLCRYQLLFKEIIRYTSPRTNEYDLWSAVSSEMQDIVMEIDELKFQREMKERTEKFIERLDGDWRMSRQQAAQLGHLIISGAIEITYSALGQSVSKPRYLGCFVFPTYIIMVRPKKMNTYQPKHWFPLRLADFEDLEDINSQQENSFIVSCKKHTFIFNATCGQEKQLWVRKIKEAIDSAKKKPLEGLILSSLSGVTPSKTTNLSISRSLTQILDGKKEISLRRSKSIQVKPDDEPCQLVKRYSADYATRKGLKTRYSETDIRPFPRQRPSSLDLLAENMFGKMSSQLKNNHQNALRLNVDHKIRDVCTQDFLSLRAWHMREIHPAEKPESLKKKKSTSLIRHSASNFSVIKKTEPLAKDQPMVSLNKPPVPDLGQDTFDCTFNLTPTITMSSMVTVKKKKKALAERVIERITSIRMKSEWNKSEDTLKCDLQKMKSIEKYTSLDSKEHKITAFAYALTPPLKKKVGWRSRIWQPKLLFKHL